MSASDRGGGPPASPDRAARNGAVPPPEDAAASRPTEELRATPRRPWTASPPGRRRLTGLLEGAAVLRILPFVSVGVALLAWLLGYQYTTFVPPPGEVWEEGWAALSEWETYAAVLTSLGRLAMGFTAAMLVGFVLSLWAARSAVVESVLASYVRFTFSLPSLLVALLALVAFGREGYAAVVVVAVLVFPFVTGPLLHGVKSLDRTLMEMARVYGASTVETVRHIALPHMASYIFGAVRNGHALAWKVLIVAEIFTVDSGIGEEFQRAFGLFNLPSVMAWLAIFLGAVTFMEYGVLSFLEKRVFKWRAGTRPAV